MQVSRVSQATGLPRRTALALRPLRPVGLAASGRRTSRCAVNASTGTTQITTTVTFKLPREVSYGQTVCVAGPAEAMGQWKVDGSLEMAWTEGHVWTAQCQLPAGTNLEYKYLIRKAGSVEWCQGDNRPLTVPADAAALEVADTWSPGAGYVTVTKKAVPEAAALSSQPQPVSAPAEADEAAAPAVEAQAAEPEADAGAPPPPQPQPSLPAAVTAVTAAPVKQPPGASGPRSSSNGSSRPSSTQSSKAGLSSGSDKASATHREGKQTANNIVERGAAQATAAPAVQLGGPGMANAQLLPGTKASPPSGSAATQTPGSGFGTKQKKKPQPQHTSSTPQGRPAARAQKHTPVGEVVVSSAADGTPEPEAAASINGSAAAAAGAATQLPISQLKSALKKHGLSTYGKKHELVERLKSAGLQ